MEEGMNGRKKERSEKGTVEDKRTKEELEMSEVVDEFEKKKAPTRRKISKLCQFCPNPKCEGYYRRDAKGACLTMKSWRKNKLTLREAIEAKHKQNKRHKETDEIRNKIYRSLTMNQENILLYEDKRLAGNIASRLVKNEIDPNEALNKIPWNLRNDQKNKYWNAVDQLKQKNKNN